MNARIIVAQVGGVLLSLLIAFFGVFNVLFSDRNGPRDAEIAFGVVFILYLISSFVIHRVSRRTGWKWFWLLVLPGALLGGGFSFPDQGINDWYTWTILGAMVVAVFIGRYISRVGEKKVIK